MKRMEGYRIAPVGALRMLRRVLMLAAGMAIAQSARAQQSPPLQIRFGPNGGYELGATSGGIETWVGRPDCGTYGNGELRANRYGGRFDLAGVLLEDLGLSLRAEWSSSHETFAAQAPRQLWLRDNRGDTPVTANHSFQLALERRRISLGTFLTWHLFGPVTLGVGPRFGFLIGSAASSQELLDASSGTIFDGGGTTRAVPDPPTTSAATMTVDACAGLWCSIPLGGRLLATLDLGGSYGVTSESLSWNQRTRGIAAGVGILFDATPTEEPTVAMEIPPPDPLPPRISEGLQTLLIQLDPPHRTRISASLSLYGLDDNNRHQDLAHVLVSEQVERSLIRVPPLVPFKRGAASLEEECAASPSAENPTGQSQPPPALRTRVCRILDLVGQRLRENKSARLMVGPGRSDAGLFEARCQAIRLRLMNRWSIAADRVSCNPSMRGERRDTMRPDGEEELLLASDDPAILAPVRSESVNRTFGTPRLKLEPYYQSDAGISRWEIMLSYRGMPIAQYESTGGAEQHETDYEWHPDVEELAADTAALVAKFTIRDSAGETATAYGSIKLSVDRHRSTTIHRIDEGTDAEEILYIIPEEQDYASQMLESIVAAALEEDRVTVIAVRPAAGSPRECGLGLQERAEHLAKVLRERLGGGGQRREIGRRSVDAREGPGEAPPGSVIILINRAGGR